MSFTAFLTEYKWVILFYLIIILIIKLKRDKFTIQAKFIALYKTKIGLKLMDKIASKYRELIKLLGYIGVGVGFTAMVYITYMITHNLYKLITDPTAKAGIGLVLPGVHIPGSPIFVPFWFGIISIFIVIIVHEFSHGVMARAYNLKVKSSGLMLFGPIPGAFVEPEEEKLAKQSDIAQYSVFAAGPFSNMLLSLLIMLIFLVVLMPVQSAITHPIGVSFEGVTEGLPAAESGITPGEIITRVNDLEIKNSDDLLNILGKFKPNETINLYGDVEHTMITSEHPDHKGKGYIGVVGIKNEVELNNKNAFMNFILAILLWIQGLFKWVFMLSLGIGLANLLPLGPVDGGRMLQTASQKILGDKKKGDKVWKRISLICLVILIILIFFPIFKSIFGFF